MTTHRRVGSIFWLVIGFYVAIHSYQLGLGRFRHPGAGLVFFLAALVLIVLSAIDFVGSFIGRPKKDEDSKERPIWVGVRWQKVLLVLVGLSAYVYFFNILGFFLSTFFLMVFLFRGVEPTKWWVAIVSSLITVLFSYLIFKIWLVVPFPIGFLGF